MTFNQIELDAIWEGFLEAIDFTDGDRRDMVDDEHPEAEWNGDMQTGDIRRYVDDFANANEDDIARAVNMSEWGYDGIGHDLWLTANGHGAGFWDRGYGDVGTRLSLAARHSGCACDAYIGDDGVMYLSGFEPRTEEV